MLYDTVYVSAVQPLVTAFTLSLFPSGLPEKIFLYFQLE